MFISKNAKLSVAPIILMLVAFIFTPLTKNDVGIMVPVGVIFTLIVGRVMYKKGWLN